jgi:hypothetical protein
MNNPHTRQDGAPDSAPDNTDAVKREVVAEAISTDLAPASAIAVLARAETPTDALDAALKPIAAGVTSADDDAKVRVQLMFPDGSLLPVELDREAGQALAAGLTEALNELPEADGADSSAGKA